MAQQNAIKIPQALSPTMQDNSVPKIPEEDFIQQNATSFLMEPEEMTEMQSNDTNIDQITWTKFTDTTKERKRKKKFGQIQTERLKSQIADDWVNRFDRVLGEQEATSFTDIMLRHLCPLEK